jgi:hypothetical protein
LKLADIRLSSKTVAIESSAFRGCASLTTITIPESVLSIGSNTFNGCKLLTTVNYLGTQEQWEMIEIVSTGNTVLKTIVINFAK